jgi:hypothetical protein
MARYRISRKSLPELKNSARGNGAGVAGGDVSHDLERLSKLSV